MLHGDHTGMAENNAGLFFFGRLTLRFRKGHRIVSKVALEPTVIAHAHAIAFPQVERRYDTRRITLYQSCLDAQFNVPSRVAKAAGYAIDHHHQTVKGIVDSLFNGGARFRGEVRIDVFQRISPYVLDEDAASGVLEPKLELPRVFGRRLQFELP